MYHTCLDLLSIRIDTGGRSDSGDRAVVDSIGPYWDGRDGEGGRDTWDGHG